MTTEQSKLADKIENWSPGKHPLTLIACERRLAVAALRAPSPDTRVREALEAIANEKLNGDHISVRMRVLAKEALTALTQPGAPIWPCGLVSNAHDTTCPLCAPPALDPATVEALKPCPFCGPGQSMVDPWFDDVSKRWAIGCGRCGASSGRSVHAEDSKEAAIKSWNTRGIAQTKDEDFHVLPGEDGEFALAHLQSALNDIDISACNAAKWRIRKAVAVIRALIGPPARNAGHLVSSTNRTSGGGDAK